MFIIGKKTPNPGRTSTEGARLVVGTPPKEHPTFVEALDEAKRLAAQHPGSEFYVMSPVATVQVESPPPPPVKVLAWPFSRDLT